MLGQSAVEVKLITGLIVLRGPDRPGLKKTVLRQHRAGNYPAAGDAFLMWDKDYQDGQLVVVPGLLKRRQIERAYYLNVAG
jgi:GH24 family phage-related lysozyme (muramidase)